MDAIYWLCAANAFIWGGIGAYVALLACRQARLARQLKNLEMYRDSDN